MQTSEARKDMEAIGLIAMILASSFLPTVKEVSSVELSLTEIEKPGKHY